MGPWQTRSTIEEPSVRYNCQRAWRHISFGPLLRHFSNNSVAIWHSLTVRNDYYTTVTIANDATSLACILQLKHTSSSLLLTPLYRIYGHNNFLLLVVAQRNAFQISSTRHYRDYPGFAKFIRFPRSGTQLKIPGIVFMRIPISLFIIYIDRRLRCEQSQWKEAYNDVTDAAISIIFYVAEERLCFQITIICVPKDASTILPRGFGGYSDRLKLGPVMSSP